MLAVVLVAVAAASPHKKAACRVICQSSHLPLAKQLCDCYRPAAGLEELLAHDGLVDKRWGLDMDLDAGWAGNSAGNAQFENDEDARKIFRFGKRSGGQAGGKRWGMEDDLAMALPWEQLDGAQMGDVSDDDRAGGKVFRFGKRSVRNSDNHEQNKA